jgi:hypothetical protein
VFVGLASGIGIGLPRRLVSSVAARSSQSSSWSSRYRMAFGKSLGRAVLREGRPGRASGGLLVGEPSNLPVENRSGVWFLMGSRPMPRILPPSNSQGNWVVPQFDIVNSIEAAEPAPTKHGPYKKRAA